MEERKTEKNNENMNKVFKKGWVVALIIAIVVAIFYGNTLKNGFIHDDHGQVEHNTFIQSFKYLPKVFTGCIWESAVGNCKETYYYRPLQSLSYLITYQISSNPWVFHLINITYFAIDIWLTYFLVNLLTKSKTLAILSAGIFLAHPVNTEVVNWIATVPELLYTLLILMSTISFVLYRRFKKPKYMWWVWITFVLSMLAKEPAVFLPFVFLILDFAIFGKNRIRDFLDWDTLKPYIFSVISFGAYLLLRVSVLGGLGADPYYKLSFFQRIYIFIDLFGAYFRKLIFPYPLNLFYTFHPDYSLLRPDFIFALVITLFFIALFAISVVKRWKIVSFALIWYIVFLAPSLIFINSIGENLFAERHVFASVIGFAILLGMGLIHLGKLWRSGLLGRYVGVTIFGSLVILSFIIIQARNKQWINDETIYVDTLTKSPDADLIRYNLAYLYDGTGKTNQALEQYNIILKRNLWRGIDKVYNNLGNMARKNGDFALAISYFQKSLVANPTHVEAYNNLGALSLEKGDILASLVYLCRANMVSPNFVSANNNFDHLVGVIQNMDDRSYGALYRQIVSQKTFHIDNSTTPFVFKDRTCTTEKCFITFSIKKDQILFPFSFLITGETGKGEIVRPRRVGTRNKTGDLVLDINPKFAHYQINFIFPTCDQIYFQVSVQND